MDSIKIVLVDDHQMFRDGVKSVLSDEAGIEIVGEVGKGTELYELLEHISPDIIIADISMPDISGIEITKTVCKEYPGIKVLVLSMHKNEEFITKSLEAGAKGYLPKDTSMSELLEAISTICQGGTYFNKEISDTVMRSIVNKTLPGVGSEKRKRLTKRETEIVKMVVDGLTNKEIAEELFISIRTVDSHKNNILQKLGLKSSVELVRYAIRNSLVNLD